MGLNWGVVIFVELPSPSFTCCRYVERHAIMLSRKVASLQVQEPVHRLCSKSQKWLFGKDPD